MEARFGDLDLICFWIEVKSVVGGGGETVVNKNLGLFRVRRGG